MSDPIDKTLDEYLSGNSQISQRYRQLDDAAVPPQLDQQVLAHARAAVAGQQQAHTDELERLRQRRKRLMRWSVPAGLAASAVLVVSIVMQSGVRHEVTALQQPASAPAVAQESRVRSSDNDGLVVLAQPDSSVRAPAVIVLPKVASEAPAQAEGKVESSAKRLQEQQHSSPVAISAVPDLANEPVYVPPSFAPAAPPPPMTASATSSAAPHTLQERQRETQLDMQRRASSQATIGITGEEAIARQQAAQARDDGLRAVAETAAARDQQTESQSSGSQADALAEIAVTGNRVRSAPAAGVGPRGTVRQRASATSESEVATAGAQIHEEPQHWLERIRQLRKDGKAQDADREWQRFREAYPDYTVAETDAARALPLESPSENHPENQSEKP